MSEVQIEYLPFTVDETPYCFWDVDVKQRNAEFIKSIDPGYFSHLAQLHSNNLDGEQKQYAAIALRAEYYHSLETLFALICATVQAPDCIIGWLLKYQNRELFAIVRKIDNHLPILNRLGQVDLTWDTIASQIHILAKDDEELKSRLCQSFGRLWARFASDFLDEDITNEYNSIKHGLRVSMGGFKLAIGVETTPGVPPSSDEMRSLGGSQYGTSFFISKQLQNRDNFQALRHSLNWQPENLANGLSLVSMSIHNIVAYLKLFNGINEENIYFRWPVVETDFESPWRLSTEVKSFNMNHVIDESSIPVLSKESILSVYENTS